MLRLSRTRWSVDFDRAPLDVVSDVFGCIDDALITVQAVDSRVVVVIDFFEDSGIESLVIADACAALEQAGADVHAMMTVNADV